MRLLLIVSLIFTSVVSGVQAYAQHKRLPHKSLFNELKLWSPKAQISTTVTHDQNILLIVFLSTECPMSISYTQTLEKLRLKYSDRLTINGVFPGKTYTDKQILDFASSYSLTFTLLRDTDMLLVKKIKAEVTPEVFLFDDQGECVYHGAIDNWLMELGKKKVKPDEHYLVDAIDKTLKGEKVTRSYIKPQGCLLNDY